MGSVLALYSSKDFRVNSLYVDPEFGTKAFSEPLMELGITVNAASANEHVAGIERETRVLKEWVRARWSTMPYQKIPIIMITELAKDVVTWLNSFPSKSSLVQTVGVRALITGVNFDYALHCWAEFGQYCQVHEDKDRKNRVDLERTTGAIALRPSGNRQGGYSFMSLNTGRVIVRQHFTICPSTQKVMDCVHALATKDGYTKPMRMDIVSLEDDDLSKEEEEETDQMPQELKVEETDFSQPKQR